MIGLMMLAAASGGGFETGNSLLRVCQDGNLKAVCAGYVSGVVDTGIAIDSHAFCMPAGVERGQIADIVTAYLTTHPQLRQYSAAVLVSAAMEDAYPCPK